MEINRIFAAEPETPARVFTAEPGISVRKPVLGMLTFPIQEWGGVYDDATALSRGTLFPPLDLPYVGREAKR